MKIKSLNDKLELYYDRIKNPQKVIGNWSIIDLDLLNSLKEIKLDNINYVDVYKNETLISLESKNYYILIIKKNKYVANEYV